MRLVKLNAIDSTNDFLKALASRQPIENFTVVTAENQTKGRGQMGSVWVSEPGKNLIMSILITDAVSDVAQIFTLNMAVACAIMQILDAHQVPELRIKWPNDIMSGAKKIGGILIENSIKSNGSIRAVAGIGLNVNQVNFENLPKASSLKIVCERNFEIDILLVQIVEKIESLVQDLSSSSDRLWQQYTDRLFKKGIPMPFEDGSRNRFMGIIQGVDSAGKLKILLEDEQIASFGIKEIQMLY